MQNNTQKYVYLILSSSSSMPAKIIKFFTRNKLNHSSFSMDDSLHRMLSFGRLKMWNPWYAGMVEEDKDKGFYKKFSDTYIQLYRFPVSDEVHTKTQQYFNMCVKEKHTFKYNFLGAMLSGFRIPVAREKQYFCSEFVAVIFKECGIREIKRNVHTYHPYFFLELPDKELLFEGQLENYSGISYAEIEAQEKQTV